jgi:hypothetical protein
MVVSHPAPLHEFGQPKSGHHGIQKNEKTSGFSIRKKRKPVNVGTSSLFVVQ